MEYSSKLLTQEFAAFIQTEVQQLPTAPCLDIIQIFDDFASNKYIDKKIKTGQELGINVHIHKFLQEPSVSDITDLIHQSLTQKHGVIVQLPVPPAFVETVNTIPYQVDVDLLSVQADMLWNQGFLPPTIGAIDVILKDILLGRAYILENITRTLDLAGKTVAVIGQGKLVGSPLLRYLKERNATIISINVDTKNPQELTQQADILITGAGKPNLINKDWLKSGCIVIDAATSESNGALVGDVDYDNIGTDLTLCRCPGGVGPLTVLYLFYNTLKIGK